jgi:hypothetical protein
MEPVEMSGVEAVVGIVGPVRQARERLAAQVGPEGKEVWGYGLRVEQRAETRLVVPAFRLLLLVEAAAVVVRKKKRKTIRKVGMGTMVKTGRYREIRDVLRPVAQARLGNTEKVAMVVAVELLNLIRKQDT